MSAPRCHTRKAQYRSESFAWKVARRWAGKLGEEIRAYRCPACRRWHIGHPKGSVHSER